MKQDRVHELTAAYALNALDEVEAAEYEAHLAGCPACRRELASLQEAAASLAYGFEAPLPPPALRERILSHARNERSNVIALRFRPKLPAAAAAAAAVAAIALGAWAFSLSSSLGDERAARAGRDRALAVLADPDAKRTALEGADGILVVAPNGAAVLVLSDLGRAPDNRRYEAWVAVRGNPRPAGLFDAEERQTVVPLTLSVPEGATVMVTVEDENGADRPTTAPFITASNS